MNSRGGVTIYVSLSLLLVMALLGTMLEVTRGKVCRVHSRRTLQVAAERLMTEYSRPLYDRYGLFFLEDNGEPLEQCVARFAGDILDADDLYDGSLDELEVTDKRYIGDHGGEELLRQIEAKMKRQLAEDVVKAGIKKNESAFSVEDSARKIDKKVEKEREEAEAGIQLCKLMKLVDGVNCASGGVRGQRYFVKMFYRGEKRGESLGITEAVVWEAIKGEMVSLDETLPELTKDSVKSRFLEQVKKVEKKTEEALSIMRQLGTALASLHLGTDPISVLEGNLQILDQTQKILTKEVTTEKIVELEVLWEGYDTQGVVFSYTGVTEAGGSENPIESFTEVLSDGILNLVLKENLSVSEKSITGADGYREWYEAVEEDVKYGERIHNFAKEQEVELEGVMGGLSQLSVSDYFLTEYGKAYFSNWCHVREEDECALDYELEYLVCGKRSDKKNLEQVIDRLFLMRTVVNATALFASPNRCQTAYTAALSVVGFTGMEPLIRFTQTLFLVLWGMAEALVDVAGILQGKHVSLMKSQSDFKVEFSELFQFSRQYIQRKVGQLPKSGQHSFEYEDYVTLFILGNKRATVCYRMMDLMQANVRRDGVEHFNLGMCLSSFEMRGVFTFPTRFFRLPQMQDMLHRSLYQYHSESTITMSYAEP